MVRSAVMIRDVFWFGGATPRSDEEAVFLGTLRSDAAAWDLDVAPDDTTSFTGLVPLYVDVSVPGLPLGTNRYTILQGAYWAGGPAGLTLRAEWGDTYLLDGGGHDNDLRLEGVGLGAAQAASMLASWFKAQLRRPIDRFDWVAAGGGVVASEWRLVDTGSRVASEGSWFGGEAPTRRVTARAQA